MDGSCSVLYCSFGTSGFLQVSCRAGVSFLHSLPRRELPGSSTFLCCCEKIPEKRHKREGGFVLVHGPSHTHRKIQKLERTPQEGCQWKMDGRA